MGNISRIINCFICIKIAMPSGLAMHLSPRTRVLFASLARDCRVNLEITNIPEKYPGQWLLFEGQIIKVACPPLHHPMLIPELGHMLAVSVFKKTDYPPLSIFINGEVGRKHPAAKILQVSDLLFSRR